MGGGELYGGVKRRVKKSSSSAKRVVAKPKRVAAKPKREGVKRRNAFNRRLMGKFGGFLNELYVEGEGQSTSSANMGGNSVERLVQQLTQQFQNNEMAGGKPRRKKSALSASPVKKVKKVKKVRRKTRGGEGDEDVATADKPVNAEGEAPADDKEGKDMGGGGYRKVKRVVRKVRSSSPSRKARPAAKARPVGKARPVRKARPTRRRSALPGRR
jgi:hypothetical protein